MANPTAQVKATKTDFGDNKRYWPVDPAVIPTTFYPGEMIGADAAGYATHYDDSADMTFLGLFATQQAVLDSTNVVGGVVQIRAFIELPRYFTMPLGPGETASRLLHIGAPVYALDSGHVTKNPAAGGPPGTPLNFANLVGYIVDVHGADPTALVANEVEIEPAGQALQRGANAGTIAAPAAAPKTFGTEILNKTVFVPNTAATTYTLPPVASTVPGDKVTFVKTTAAAFAFTLKGNGAELVQGANTYASGAVQFATAVLVSDGTQWIVENKVT